MSTQDDLAARVEAEEFAGGPMTKPGGVYSVLEEMFGPEPHPIPAGSRTPRRVIWVVKQGSGQELRVLAEWHSTHARPEGTEVQFYNGTGDDKKRVATVRAGSWHWVVESTALNPESGEKR